jgi:hypothetical protein
MRRKPSMRLVKPGGHCGTRGDRWAAPRLHVKCFAAGVLYDAVAAVDIDPAGVGAGANRGFHRGLSPSDQRHRRITAIVLVAQAATISIPGRNKPRSGRIIWRRAIRRRRLLMGPAAGALQPGATASS